jgi:hypothetical protein
MKDSLIRINDSRPANLLEHPCWTSHMDVLLGQWVMGYYRPNHNWYDIGYQDMTVAILPKWCVTIADYFANAKKILIKINDDRVNQFELSLEKAVRKNITPYDGKIVDFEGVASDRTNLVLQNFYYLPPQWVTIVDQVHKPSEDDVESLIKKQRDEIFQKMFS